MPIDIHTHVLHSDYSLAEIHAFWIQRIKAHALDHYNTDGWDYCVECWDAAELIDIFTKPISQAHPCTTYAEALAAALEVCQLLDEQRRSVRNEIF